LCRTGRDVSRMNKPKNAVEAMVNVKAQALESPVEKAKALVKELKKKAQIAMKTREVLAFGKRAQIVNKSIEEQTPYEKRGYMRNRYVEDVNQNTVTHLTSHTKQMLIPVIIGKMQEMVTAGHDAMFKATELESVFQIFGPAKGDVVRGALKHWAKEANGSKIAVHKEEHGKVARYTFELLDLPDLPATPKESD